MKAFFKKCEKMCSEKCEKGEWIISLLTRVSVGLVFSMAGWGKFENMARTVGFFESIGIPMASIQAPFVAGVEFLGGLCLILGLATRLVSMPLIITMIVALLTAHASEVQGVFDLLGMSPYLYILLLGWLVVHGGGKVSLDAQCCKKG